MIRAGRNLPDKEFRYLRTVIVTADIHGGLDPKLAQRAFTFPHWSHVTPYTSTCVLAESCVFAKQSVGPCHCGPRKGHSLYRRYGANLPSSLRRFNSRALEYSSRIPVSVCGTGRLHSKWSAFLGTIISRRSATVVLSYPIRTGLSLPNIRPRHIVTSGFWNINQCVHRLLLTASP